MIVSTRSDYESMLSSIDFFSQNLHIEQIVEYGFSIFNALEKPAASVIYVIDETDDFFKATFQQGYLIHLDDIVKTKKHDDFAVRNGFLLVDRNTQLRYFDEDFIENLNISKILPLIIDDHLYGFIISSGGPQDNNIDFEFLTRFNYLMNLSLEKASRYLERAKLKKEIDKKIFNLNSISQTMKILLSELDVNNILQASVDVIREITTSSVTSIGLYDEIEEVIKIESYENITSKNKIFENFKLRSIYPLIDQAVFDVEKEREKLEDLFEDVSKFDVLGAEYVILIVKDLILGFVTIGKSMTDKKYDSNLLDRIKDITSIMFIALTNANQFSVINEQKEQMRLQLVLMKHMNRIIKSVNSSESISELTDMVLSTMNLTFGIESAMMLSFDEEQYQIRGAIGEHHEGLDENLVKLMRDQVKTDLLSCYTMSDIKFIFGEEILSRFEGMNCFICAPIFKNQLFEKPIGMIVVTKTKQRLHESQSTMVEMLVNSIGPVMTQLLKKEQYDEFYIQKPEIEIEKLHQKYSLESDLYSLNFNVFIKKVEILPFVEVNLYEYEEYDFVLFNNLVVVFSTKSIEPQLYDEVSGVNPTFEEVKSLVTLALL